METCEILSLVLCNRLPERYVNKAKSDSPMFGGGIG